MSYSIANIGRFIKNIDKRTLLASKNIVVMLIFKGGNILISLLYVPLLINTLNTYNYGIWLTITSIVAWLNLFDVGLGNGLRNNLAKALAKEDYLEARVLISTSYIILIVFVLLLIILFSIINIFLNWSEILNVSFEMNNELKKIVSIVFYFFSVQFVLKLVNSVLLAFQKPALSSFIVFIGQLLSYIVIFISVKLFFLDSFIYLATIISFIPVFILFIFSFYVFKYPLRNYRPDYKYFKLDYFSTIFNLGLKFFFLQIITIVIFQTNNLIIAHKLGQSSVTEYNIVYKYLGVVSMMFTIVLTPFWSAVTDAYYRNDFNWIKKTVQKLNFIWIGMVAIGLGLIFFANDIYSFWLGDSVKASKSLLYLTFIYFIIFMRYGIYGYIINGIGKVKLQLIITAIIALLYVPVTLIMSENYNLEGVLLSMILFAAINSLWSYLQYKRIIDGTAIGIWNK